MLSSKFNTPIISPLIPNTFHQKMMQPEVFQPLCPFFNVINPSLDQAGFYGLNMDSHVDVCEFSSSFNTPDDLSEMSSIPYFSSIFPNDQFVQSPAIDSNLQVIFPVEDYLLDMEGLEPNFSDEMEFIFSESEGNFPSQGLSSGGENVWSPSPSIKSSEASMNTATIPSSLLTFPGEDSQLDNQLSVLHLLKAYGEAMERGQKELADVIMRCVTEKVSPAGEALERLAFNLSQDDLKKQGDYLRQESCKNFESAFRAFYQIFPYGRFAHFAANSAILEAVPADAETIHIVDFDMGEGVQWPPMIEALAQQHKAVKLTALKWEKDDCDWAPLMWRFEETKRRLADHARSVGLKLKVEEMGIEDLVSEIKKTNKRGGRKEWLAFNFMVGLPHMGRVRSRKLVQEFQRVAKELMANSVYCNTSNRGILTFGDGDTWENLTGCSGFGSFFDGNMVHYQALLESIESNFPIHLAEARMALECLFVAPYISSQDWFQKWMEIKEGYNLQVENGLQGWRVGKENFEEAREMVKQKLSPYGVRIGGHSNNELILEWKGTPLARVSTWRN